MQTFRKICHWLHRELGFLAVGLTLVYGISGIVVNHAHHWDANYERSREIFHIDPVSAGPTEEITPLVLQRLRLAEPIKSTWRAARDKLQVFLADGTMTVTLSTGEVIRERFKARPLIFDLNYMHLNTGKGPWTGISDVFAGILIILAITGIFLVRGQRGLAGRGGILMGLGFLLPLIYVVLERYA